MEGHEFNFHWVGYSTLTDCIQIISFRYSLGWVLIMKPQFEVKKLFQTVKNLGQKVELWSLV